MKKILLLLLIPSLLFCSYQKKKEKVPAEKIFDFLRNNLNKNSTIIFLNVNKNNEAIIQELEEIILKKQYFNIQDKKNLSELAKQSMMQDEPHFIKNETHKFIPSDWGIFIEGKTICKRIFFKKITHYKYKITIDSITKGTTKNILRLNEFIEKKYSVTYLIISLFFITLALFFIQFLTKGYYIIFLILAWIVLIFLTFYLYFFI